VLILQHVYSNHHFLGCFKTWPTANNFIVTVSLLTVTPLPPQWRQLFTWISVRKQPCQLSEMVQLYLQYLVLTIFGSRLLVVQVIGSQPASIFEGILGILMVDPWNAAVDGVLNEENLGRKLKTRGYHFKRNTYPPGSVLHDHAHEEHRKEAILSGQLKFSMIGKEV